MPSLTFANGIHIDLIVEGTDFRGIGAVTLGGKLLRSAEEPIWPEIATPDGLEATRYAFLGVERRGDAYVVVTRPYFRVGHRMEWTEHGLHPRVSTASWSREHWHQEGRLEWILRPDEEELDGVRYRGFSYGFRYHCPGFAIYQIEDKATWELGGSAVGNTFVMRNTFSLSIVTFEEGTAFSTGWTLPGIPNPYIFQHLPLYSQLQGFTWQHDDELVLLTVHQWPSHVRSLFQKAAGDRKLLHFNQFCFDLTDDVTTPARRVLVGRPKSLGRTALLNHFLRVRDAIHNRIRKYYGIRLDKVVPAAAIETWQIAKTKNFRAIFEQLHRWGIRRAFLMPLWRSNETDIVPRFEGELDRYGFMGNMCCPLELEIADCYGGWEGFRQLLRPAVELGIETYMWYGSHFSSWSPLRARIADIFARDVSGQFNRNNYGHVLFALNQRSRAYQEYLVDRFRKAKECGLSGVFRDSHFNMATDTINFLHQPYEEEQPNVSPDRVGFAHPAAPTGRERILSMHDAEAAIQRRFQEELGMFYYVESAGVLAASRVGTDYALVRGNEFLFTDVETGLNAEKMRQFGDDPEMVYFRGLSVRLIYTVAIDPNRFPEPGSIASWWRPQTMVPMVRAFMRVEPYMDQLWLLEDDRGVLWKGKGREVIFAYRNFDHTLDGEKLVEDVMTGEIRLVCGPVRLEGRKVYLISEPA